MCLQLHICVRIYEPHLHIFKGINSKDFFLPLNEVLGVCACVCAKGTMHEEGGGVGASGRDPYPLSPEAQLLVDKLDELRVAKGEEVDNFVDPSQELVSPEVSLQEGKRKSREVCWEGKANGQSAGEKTL